MIRVLAFTKYSEAGPSSRYRHYNYQACLKSNGIDFLISPLFTASYFSTNTMVVKMLYVVLALAKRMCVLLSVFVSRRGIKLVIIEYELFPFFPAVIERLLVILRIPYIVDYDDAIFHKYDQHCNALVRLLLKDKIATVMKYAEVVTTGNEYLGNYARRHNSAILRLPTVVVLEKYKKKLDRSVDKKEVEAPFLVAWIGSKSTSNYVLDILPAMVSFAEKYHVHFNLIGFDSSLLGLDCHRNINVIPWDEATEIDELLKCDVGIMPLKNDPWSKGKCGFKLIQYMSCQKPVIASPVGINTSLVVNGENGFLAETNEEWFSAFETLYLNKELRIAMGRRNLKKVEEDYNYANNCLAYSQLIKDTVNR